MYHTLAYRESVDSAGAFADINAVQGSAEYVQNNHHILSSDMYLEAMYAGSAGMTRARLVAPSLRIVAPPNIRPFSASLLPPTDPNVADFRNIPIVLKAREEIAFEAIEATAGAEVVYGVMFIGDGQYNLQRRQPYVIRASGATTVVAGAWTTINLTWDDALPAGTYEVIGFEAVGATCVAARLIFPLASVWRPGTIGQATEGGRTWRPFIDGGMGVLGRFVTTALPTVEFLCNAADTAQVVWLKCQRIGN